MARLPAIIPLAAAVFDDGDRFTTLPHDAAEKPGLLLVLACIGDDRIDGDRIDSECVGFKLGYRRNESTFYSWLGGVRPDARGQGVARQLMDAQHHTLAQDGYRFVTTETFNRYRPMLLLNITAGFDVVGTYSTGDGETKIMLRKTLTPATQGGG